MKINAENKAKISMAGTKHISMATAVASKPLMRPRTALGDISNKISEHPQAKVPLKKEAKTSCCLLYTSDAADDNRLV